MDSGEAIVARSENHSYLEEEAKRSVFGDNFHQMGYFHYNDDYSDIYFDKSCINMDEASIWNFSNLPKEIHLDQDNISDDEIFLRPNLPETNLHKSLTLNARKSFGANIDSLDENEPPVVTSKIELNHEEKDNHMEPSLLPTSVGNSRGEEVNKPDVMYGTSNRNDQNLSEDILNNPSFTKNEGKLVFKITRFNRVTQKEKWLTKNRRIISKCPHTSLKYYAKGMCK